MKYIEKREERGQQIHFRLIFLFMKRKFNFTIALRFDLIFHVVIIVILNRMTTETNRMIFNDKWM